jgi:hypothetical protein
VVGSGIFSGAPNLMLDQIGISQRQLGNRDDMRQTIFDVGYPGRDVGLAPREEKHARPRGANHPQHCLVIHVIHVKVGELEPPKLPHQRLIHTQNIGFDNVVELVTGRDADASAARAYFICHSRRHLYRKANPVFDRAAIPVGPLVCIVGKKLVDDVTVGSMDLNAAARAFIADAAAWRNSRTVWAISSALSACDTGTSCKPVGVTILTFGCTAEGPTGNR